MAWWWSSALMVAGRLTGGWRGCQRSASRWTLHSRSGRTAAPWRRTYGAAMTGTAHGSLSAAALAGQGYMARGKGYGESRDAGDTWQRPGEGIRFSYLWGLAIDPADPDTIVVSGARGPAQAHNPTSAESAVYRRVAGQAAWQEIHD